MYCLHFSYAYFLLLIRIYLSAGWKRCYTWLTPLISNKWVAVVNTILLCRLRRKTKGLVSNYRLVPVTVNFVWTYLVEKSGRCRGGKQDDRAQQSRTENKHGRKWSWNGFKTHCLRLDVSHSLVIPFRLPCFPVFSQPDQVRVSLPK